MKNRLIFHWLVVTIGIETGTKFGNKEERINTHTVGEGWAGHTFPMWGGLPVLVLL